MRTIISLATKVIKLGELLLHIIPYIRCLIAPRHIFDRGQLRVRLVVGVDDGRLAWHKFSEVRHFKCFYSLGVKSI